MPIWLRRFTFETLKSYYDKETERIEKQNNLLKNTNNSNNIAKPNIPTPTYTAKKAPKK